MNKLNFVRYNWGVRTLEWRYHVLINKFKPETLTRNKLGLKCFDFLRKMENGNTGFDVMKS